VLVDDYIHACDPVDNYLTRYSGVEEGDLNPKESKEIERGREGSEERDREGKKEMEMFMVRWIDG
jgi:hypothetical protein